MGETPPHNCKEKTIFFCFVLCQGVLLISLALCADAVIGNLQEREMNKHSASNAEMILYSYSIGVVYIFVWVAITGSLVPAFTYCLEVLYMFIVPAEVQYYKMVINGVV